MWLEKPSTLTGNRACRASVRASSARRAFSSQKHHLQVEVRRHQGTVNPWNVAAANPAGIDEDGELLRVKTEFLPQHPGVEVVDLLKLRVDRHADDPNPMLFHTVFQQFGFGALVGNDVEVHIRIAPRPPGVAAGIGDDGDKRNFAPQIEVVQDARDGVLQHRVHRHDEIRAVFVEEPFQIGFGVPLDKDPLLRVVAVDEAVVVLDVFLVGPQQKVIDVAGGPCHRTAFFQGVGRMNQKIDTFGNLGQSRFERAGSAGVTSAGIGGQNKNLFFPLDPHAVRDVTLAGATL